ncbi:hypothetical protein D3C87_1924030 [compost metagenome]
MLATDIDQCIHRTSTAQHSALRKNALASVHGRLWLGFMAREQWTRQQPGEAGGNMDQWMGIARTGLNQQNGGPGFDQATC